MFPKAFVGSGASARARCFFSKLSNGRLSPINLSRSSSFATANAPEAYLGSRDEGGSTQANSHHSILRIKARHCCRATAKNEESSPSASGSSGLKKTCATQRYYCSTSGDSPSNGQFQVLLLCRIERSRFLMPCDYC